MPESIAVTLIVLTFIVGYFAIAAESRIRVNKTASALIMAVITWMLVFLVRGHSPEEDVTVLGEHLSEVSQILFFLMGAMALVELIDAHQGFKVVTNLIRTSSKRRLLWVLGFVTFFLSAVLDNLTTTIVMVSLLRKLIADRNDRLMLGSVIVVAANAGGAWTPIGDVTTTMLWINGNITTLGIMRTLFVPSVVSLVVTLLIVGKRFRGRYSPLAVAGDQKPVPGSKRVFYCGVAALVFVPVFKALTGLPPFMGILIGLGVLWFLTDIIHHKHQERAALRMTHVLTRIDVPSMLFFLGILLCIGALDSVGLLRALAEWVGQYIQNTTVISTLFGIISAVIDNVPLVAAGTGMYDMAAHPVDSPLWQTLAYCAGTGGSILIIGSAAGVAFMGMEKVDFMWYFKRVSLVAFIGYLAGVGAYVIQQQLVM